MFRIYTEDINRDRIEAILNGKFQGFTLYPARGCWKGACENSVIAEISDAPAWEVLDAAREIKNANNQEAVLVTEIPEKEVLFV